MSKSLKAITLTVGALVGLLVLAAISVFLFLDVNAYKPRLEAAASDAMGMEVTVGGRLGIGFFPGLLFTLEDVRIRYREADVATASFSGSLGAIPEAEPWLGV